MADKDTPCMLVRDGAEIVFRMPIERLLQLTARSNDGYEIVNGDAYVSGMMRSLNRQGDGGYTEIESLLVAEFDHVLDLQSDENIDDEPPAP